MSVDNKTCEELCKRSTCNYHGDTDTECFARIPEDLCLDYDLYSEGLRRGLTYPCYRRRTPYLLQVQERLDKLIATLPTKLLSGESSTPFSKDSVWAKTKLLGKGASGSVYRCRKAGEDCYKYAVKELLLNDTPVGINSLKEVLHEVEGLVEDKT